MKEIKITEKTTKQGFVNILKDYLASEIVDKNLSDRIKYALDMFAKDMTKVAKSDLRELAEEVVKSLTPATPAPAPVEASLKPKKSSGKKSSKSEEVPAEEVEETPEETPEAEKTPAKAEKAPKKLSKPKKAEVLTATPATKNGSDSKAPCAKLFPLEIDHPELGKLISCHDAYQTYDEIIKALDEEKTLYFACYWTKRHIREYGYADLFSVPAPKGGFPNDLDIVMAVLPCETIKRLFAMSRITEALYKFDEEDFTPIEDIDPATGEKFFVRVSEGMEFEIYRPESEEVVK